MGNNKNIGSATSADNPPPKTATPMNVANTPGSVSGCFAQPSGFSAGLSVVGSLGISFRTGAEMVDGCTQAETNRSSVAQGIQSDGTQPIYRCEYVNEKGAPRLKGEIIQIQGVLVCKPGNG